MHEVNLLEYWQLVWHMVNNITVGKQYNGGVGGKEDQNVPDTMQVREAHPSPVRAEEPVIDPGGESHANDTNTSLTQVNYSPVLLLLQLHRHQAYTGDGQQHQAECIDGLKYGAVNIKLDTF